MSLLASQQHEFLNVFDGATMITIRRRYEGYINLAKTWTSERNKHNQEEKSEDEEPDAKSSRTRKQMINKELWTYTRMFNYSKKK